MQPYSLNDIRHVDIIVTMFSNVNLLGYTSSRGFYCEIINVLLCKTHIIMGRKVYTNNMLFLAGKLRYRFFMTCDSLSASPVVVRATPHKSQGL